MTTFNLSANTTSSNDSDTQNVQQADTVVVSITASYGLTLQSSSNCSTSIVGGGGNPTTITLTVSFSNTGSYSVVLYQSFGGRTYTLTGTVSSGGTPTIVAPTISSVTSDNAKSPNVTATVNLSANGSGGTLKYAQTTSNSVPSSGWQTGNTFSHPRNSTRYYWASQDENTSGAFDG